MSQEILLSYIIPVYNSEKYIEKCLNSFDVSKWIEIIVVDDGSGDSSINIINNFIKNSRIEIRLYCIQHHGLSYARNYGINKARGKYVAFLDSDDWISPGAIKGICSLLRDSSPDVLITYISGIPEVGVHRSFCDMHLNRKLIKDSRYGIVPNYLLDKCITISPSVRYIIDRSFIIDRNIRFYEDVVNEDIIWTSTLLCFDLVYDYFIEDYYCYRLRSDSLSSVEDFQYYQDLLVTINRHFKLFDSYENDDIKRFVLRRIAYYLDKLYVGVQNKIIGVNYINNNLKRRSDIFKEIVGYCSTEFVELF